MIDIKKKYFRINKKILRDIGISDYLKSMNYKSIDLNRAVYFNEGNKELIRFKGLSKPRNEEHGYTINIGDFNDFLGEKYNFKKVSFYIVDANNKDEEVFDFLNCNIIKISFERNEFINSIVNINTGKPRFQDDDNWWNILEFTKKELDSLYKNKKESNLNSNDFYFSDPEYKFSFDYEILKVKDITERTENIFNLIDTPLEEVSINKIKINDIFDKKQTPFLYKRKYVKDYFGLAESNKDDKKEFLLIHYDLNDPWKTHVENFDSREERNNKYKLELKKLVDQLIKMKERITLDF